MSFFFSKIKGVNKNNTIKSIGILTSGGDAPGMNAAIRATVRYGIHYGFKMYGIQRGYLGLLEGDIQSMSLSSVANIIQRGGTILKTSRSKEFTTVKGRQKAAHQLAAHLIDALVVIGGDGSLTGAYHLQKETGIKIVGLPGTIDNDMYGTDETIGFDTAVNTALQAIDRIRDTASSHDRLFLIEVMGRESGFIATHAAIGGGAETVVVPENKTNLHEICSAIDRGIKRGKLSSIIIVAEGKQGGGMATQIAHQLSQKNYNPRVCILGHTQRGGSPTAQDRALASALGAAAILELKKGKSNVMVGLQNNNIKLTPLKTVATKRKKLDPRLIRLVNILAK